MRNENVFREAREFARHCIFPERRQQLRDAVDECKACFDHFNISASRADFQELIGLWTKMLIAMDAVGPWIGPPTETGGRMVLPDKQAAVG